MDTPRRSARAPPRTAAAERAARSRWLARSRAEPDCIMTRAALACWPRGAQPLSQRPQACEDAYLIKGGGSDGVVVGVLDGVGGSRVKVRVACQQFGPWTSAHAHRCAGLSTLIVSMIPIRPSASRHWPPPQPAATLLTLLLHRTVFGPMAPPSRFPHHASSALPNSTS